jgi:7-carboxy-7-deazaguanine synthase
LETSGTTGVPLRLTDLPSGVMRVVDIKTPGSGISETEIDWPGIASLGPGDEIKIVCCNRTDYEWARDRVVGAGRLPLDAPVTFSPAWGELSPRALAEWILDDRLPVRMQIQLHKVIWPDAEGGV